MCYQIGLFSIIDIVDNFDHNLSNICFDYFICTYVVGLHYIIINNICDLQLDSWYIIYASNLCIWIKIMTHGGAYRLSRRGGRGRDASRQ